MGLLDNPAKQRQAARQLDLTHAGGNFVLTRRVSGASRGMFEPFFMGLRDSGASSLIMSGDRTEGPLVNNVRATNLPVGRGRLIQASRPPKTVQTIFAGQDEKSPKQSGRAAQLSEEAQ